jgi:hypothetical protein
LQEGQRTDPFCNVLEGKGKVMDVLHYLTHQCCRRERENRFGHSLIGLNVAGGKENEFGDPLIGALVYNTKK